MQPPTLSSAVPPSGGRHEIEVLFNAGRWREQLLAETAAGLSGLAKEVPATWLYDDVGSTLFEAITRLDAYYPTRAERSILEARAQEVARLSGAATLVELGAGSAAKTRVLLDGLRAVGTLRRYVPVDVAEPTLRAAAASVASEYPDVNVHGVVGDFRQPAPAQADDGPRLVAFLGGTIGNLTPQERKEFFCNLVDAMGPGDSFLLGTDLVKDPSRLVAAYDDPAGVTAAFNRNVLSHLNRELGANFRPERFDHVARFDPEPDWVQMLLVATEPMRVSVPGLDIEIGLLAGEPIQTEISTKFRRAGVTAEMAAAGMSPGAWWTDPAGDYALSLWHR
ncbi:MAG: L-histidine N(alpha)-methyltransferase [Acidimicrobiales bacterium]